MIDLYLACVKLGVIFVPINILYRDREIAHILQRCRARRPWSRDAAIRIAPSRCGRPRELTAEAAAHARHTRPASRSMAMRPPGIIYTSGTTGASKGAVLTHNNFAANAVNLLACWQITAADRFLLALPLFHVHGLGNGLHCWLISGCRMRLLERFEHQKAAAEFLDFRPTLFFGVPTIYVRLLELAGGRRARDRRLHAAVRLRLGAAARAGAGRVPRALRPHHSGALRHERDAHEHQQSLRRRAAPGQRRPAAAGRLRAAAGCEVADGERARSICKGPTSSPATGGARRPRAPPSPTAGSAPATWPTRSPDGYYTLCGRKSDLIISGGFNIYPREIEEFLQEQEEVAEAAVVGRADRLRGEVPVAFVVLKTAGRSRRAGGTLPRPIWHPSRCRASSSSVDKLPRNAMGKIQKHLLPPR